MSNEAKCNCTICNEHISFPPELAGQTIACPHCQMETVLFIPTTPRISVNKKGKNVVGIVIFAFALCSLIIFASLGQVSRLRVPVPSPDSSPQRQSIASQATNLNHEPTPPELVIVSSSGHWYIESNQFSINLKPVVGAFGWTLGDQLPQRLQAEVQDTPYAKYVPFKPEQEWPPFNSRNSFSLDLTPDGRICSISADAFESVYKISEHPDGEDFDDALKRVISVLSGKYGVRRREINGDGVGTARYDFGTLERTAHLDVSLTGGSKCVTLQYCDRNLRNIADAAHDAARAAEDARKKAALSNSF